MLVDNRPELGIGKIVGVVNDKGDVTSVIVTKHQENFAIDAGDARDVIWVDAGNYITLISPNTNVQPPLPGMYNAIYNGINARELEGNGK